MHNALTLHGARWVNQCKNGFNKRCLEYYYLLPYQLSALSVKISAPYSSVSNDGDSMSTFFQICYPPHSYLILQILKFCFEKLNLDYNIKYK